MTDNEGRVAVCYLRGETKDYLTNALPEVIPEPGLKHGLTQGMADSTNQVTGWIELILDHRVWLIVTGGVLGSTLIPFLKKLFEKLGDRAGDALADFIKDQYAKLKLKGKVARLADIVDQACNIEGERVGLFLALPIQGSLSGCGYFVKPADKEELECQLALFIATFDGLQIATEYLRDEPIPNGDPVRARLTPEGIAITWFNAHEFKEKSALIVYEGEKWVLRNDKD